MVSGAADKAKGRIKVAIGDLTGDDELEHEGEADETAGKAKDAVESAKEKVNDAIDSVKDKLT